MHLQQIDQVASVLCTVGFWLKVCGDIRVLIGYTLWIQRQPFNGFSYTYLPYFIFSRFCCAGEDFCLRNLVLIYFINYAHWEYPTTLNQLTNLLGVGI